MKKQIFTLVAALFAFTATIQAQCDPDTSIKEPGYYPDVLAPAVAGDNYSQVIQLRVIKDTAVDYNGFPVTAVIDSINLLEIIGLPASFSYQCYNATCSYIPSETGCALMTGSPTMADVGTHNLDLVLKIYAHVATIILEQDDTLTDQFSLVVNKTGGISIQPNTVKPNFYPNPSVSGTFEIDHGHWVDAQVRVYDLKGKLVMDQPLQKRVLDLSTLPSGMYSYILTNKNGSTSVGRLMSARH